MQADPANVELQQIVAQSCLWAAQYQCALDGFRQILMTQPNSAAAHVLIGEALDGLGKTPEAITEFQQAVQVSPHEPNVHFGLGFLYWKSQSYEKAKAEFQAELANDGDNAQAWAYLGDTEMKLGNREQAAFDLNKAIQLRSDVRLAYIDQRSCSRKRTSTRMRYRIFARRLNLIRGSRMRIIGSRAPTRLWVSRPRRRKNSNACSSYARSSPLGATAWSAVEGREYDDLEKGDLEKDEVEKDDAKTEYVGEDARRFMADLKHLTEGLALDPEFLDKRVSRFGSERESNSPSAGAPAAPTVEGLPGG